MQELNKAVDKDINLIQDVIFDASNYHQSAKESGIEKLRQAQVKTLSMFALTATKFTFIELPPAFGKTTLLSIHADVQIQRDPNAKVVISVPNEVLKKVTESKCTRAAENPKDIALKGSAGIYICTHAELTQLPQGVLSNALLLIDEFHTFCQLKARLVKDHFYSGLLKMEESNQTIGVSATLG